MLADYGLIGLFLIVAILFSVVMIVIPVVLRYLKVIPSNPNPIKESIFECGMETIGKTWVRFNFHYYFYALVFLALDVLVVFLYPWAVQLKQLGPFSLYVVLILVFIVFVGYLYAWKKKALEWK
ncbi:MAG: NADH-quinone oxidoreductase subunit A [Dehalococcoidales bacterium]|nr:NADH-quinone oxidoreductase subunit A [Dehalococcoidales bacterium]